MHNIHIEAFSEELTNDLYYKRIQKELREKHLKAEALKKTEDGSNVTEHHVVEVEKKEAKKATQKLIDQDYFKDQVLLTSQELNESLDNTKEETEKTKKKQEALFEKMKYNAHEIMRNYMYKIDFKARKDDFIEMFKYNLQETRSHNNFTAKFASFKAGIVGQILSAIGIPPTELKKLKKEAFKEAFEENYEAMQEHIYHAELAEVLNGRTKKSQRTIKLFSKLTLPNNKYCEFLIFQVKLFAYNLSSF